MSTTPSLTNQKLKPAIRAYLGGSFDPVHNGHLQMALSVYEQLAPIATEQQRELQVSLLPNARSPFKQQSTDPADRLAMLKLAVQDMPVQINELELWQTPPVYSIDSVRTLRQRYPDDSLIFIMGMDNARSLDKWKQGLQLTDYVHLWIFDRDKPVNAAKQDITMLASQLPSALQPQVISRYAELLPISKSLINEPSFNKTLANMPLKDTFKGRIYIDTHAVITVSSTEIRKQFAKYTKHSDYSLSAAKYANTQPANLAHWLNPKVYQYIITHQLYSAD